MTWEQLLLCVLIAIQINTLKVKRQKQMFFLLWQKLITGTSTILIACVTFFLF